jgi:membrane protease YdiL (CAAX protease family)
MLSQKPWLPERVLQLLIRLLASLLLGMILVSWLNSTEWLPSGQMKFLTIIVGTLSFHGVALFLVHLFLRAEGISWRDAFGFVTPRLGRALLLAALVAVAVLPIAWSLGQLSAKAMQFLRLQPVVQSPVQILQAAGSLETKLLIGFLAILVAPIAEELVFRGLIYPTLKQNGFPRLALWGTSLLFALIHNNLMIVLPLTFLAVVLTLLYETTENLLAPMLAHSLFNFVNFFWVVAAQRATAASFCPS